MTAYLDIDIAIAADLVHSRSYALAYKVRPAAQLHDEQVPQ